VGPIAHEIDARGLMARALQIDTAACACPFLNRSVEPSRSTRISPPARSFTPRSSLSVRV